MARERLSAQDSVLFCSQAASASLQIGALALFEAGPLLDDDGHVRLDDLRERLVDRLDAVPRFRQRLTRVPFDLDRPVWEDDPRFDIAEHVRSTAIPAPGGPEELRGLVSRLLETPLDADRPLWELWFVEGVEDDRVGVVVKASHVMADGMALLEFALTLLDADPDGEERPHSRWRPAPTAGSAVLTAEAMRHRGGDLLSLAGRSLRAMVRPDRVTGELRVLTQAAMTMLTRAPALPVTAPVGGRRDFAWLNLPLEKLERVKGAHDVTLNDVVLAIVTGALRHYLLARGDSVEGTRPRVLVPVSTHAPGTGAHGGDGTTNRFSFFTVTLPVLVDDPVVQLRAIHTETTQAKDEHQTSIVPALFTIADLVPVALLRGVAPPVIAHQPFVNLAVTNLPGSPTPLYLSGARLVDLHPFITVTGNLGAIIGVISYTDRLGVSITVDPDVVPDLDALVEAIEIASAELISQG